MLANSKSLRLTPRSQFWPYRSVMFALSGIDPPPTSPASIAARVKPARPRTRLSRRRSHCRVRATASSSTSKNFSRRCVLR